MWTLTLTSFLAAIALSYAQYPECGYSQYPDSGASPVARGMPDEKVVGGWETRVGEFPYQALLLYFGSAFCGGFLIDAGTVLTAAHCTSGDPARNHQIVLGEHMRDDDSDGAPTITYDCSDITEHEDYGPVQTTHDISLMFLATPAELNDFVQPVCLPEQGQLFVGMEALVSGWGSTQSGGSMTSELRAAHVTIISDEECSGADGCLEGETDETMVCAGNCGPNETDTCQGDSGGPMAVKECDAAGCDQGGTWRVVGITSWGYGCAAFTPGVYAEVSHFIDWINANSR